WVRRGAAGGAVMGGTVLRPASSPPCRWWAPRCSDRRWPALQPAPRATGATGATGATRTSPSP
ncbi:MAG: hypothetical protein AVDCRST_MAG34-2169, partial [uncultured Nocardioidaceae bacterium]